MQFSVATANLYQQPFEQVLEIIAEAGFQNIELDLFWERKAWAMAQHLRNVPVRQVVRSVAQSGLRITSIHDGGGVLETRHSTAGFINPDLNEYLNDMDYAPDCLVFHTPHIEGDEDVHWWEQISGQVVKALESYRNACSFVTIENMPFFPGYYVPLTTPEELNRFAVQNGLGITFDTTHYAQIGTDIVAAATKLRNNIKTLHLSDFVTGRLHVYVGEGQLNLAGLFDVIDTKGINAVTLECSLSSTDNPGQEMSYNNMVSRLSAARIWLEALL